MIDKINKTNKRIKKYHRQMNLLELIDNIDNHQIVFVHVYRFKDHYCEAFNEKYGFLRFELIPKVFLSQYKIDSTETFCSISYQNEIDQYKKGDIMKIILKKKWFSTLGKNSNRTTIKN